MTVAKFNIGKAPPSVILIRMMVGGVFLVEGILKFMYPDALAVGRFTKIGIPFPQVMGPFVGGVETVCGALVLIGLLTRFAAIPLLITISVAIISTKIPMWLGHDFLGFHVAKLARYGFLSMMHEARADFSMLLGSIFLICVGSGPVSVDARLVTPGEKTESSEPPIALKS